VLVHTTAKAMHTMTKEERNDLLRDLTSRVIYNVVVECTEEENENVRFNSILTFDHLDSLRLGIQLFVIRPLLRPMSSMTSEEREELSSMYNAISKPSDGISRNAIDVVKIFDWLNKHMFDYNHLIERGLAIEAPTWAYNTNKMK